MEVTLVNSTNEYVLLGATNGRDGAAATLYPRSKDCIPIAAIGGDGLVAFAFKCDWWSDELGTHYLHPTVPSVVLATQTFPMEPEGTPTLVELIEDPKQPGTYTIIVYLRDSYGKPLPPETGPRIRRNRRSQ